MKRKRADPVDDTSAADRPKKRTRQRASLGAPSRSAIAETQSNSDASSSSTHSYALRMRKKNLYNSYAADEEAETEDDCRSDYTIQGAQERSSARHFRDEDTEAPGLSAEELDVVRRTILHTVLPSWIDRLPRNLGAANHGSLKAAEWLILYKVYYTIALIPLWVKGLRDAATEESRRRISLLLESTSTLSQITHFLTLPKIKFKDLSELNEGVAWRNQHAKLASHTTFQRSNPLIWSASINGSLGTRKGQRDVTKVTHKPPPRPNTQDSHYQMAHQLKPCFCP
ncbi:hypothetical protein PTTG_30011 [Puccinia triticina 1-1 BBBD Race 1]|uniref:Uncharacterized protein n=1 Tax=Puccinia triticina (isolate 1-1 / race 1 (BBBD)) TaxID=630390 RepID=A0A180G1B2_PUCT1|nr:hypothetical protein PTTG_30011 [Puccinia triticina 1-1 BBBD Race 1]